MNRKKYLFLSILAAVAVIAAVLYFAAPSYLYNKSMDKARKEAGLTVKSVNIQDFKIVYSEGGKGDTIILLHGFSANKDHWNNFAKNLTPRYHVIIPDLPGFGDSSKKPGADYSIGSQVERVRKFAEALKLEKFHIAGNSMGGNISGTFSATYPGMVKSLTLIDASGVKTPVQSDRMKLSEKGINPLVVKDVKDFDRALEFNFANPPKIPSLVKKYLAKKAVQDSTMNGEISTQLAKTDYFALEKKLDKIKAPTMIIWGDLDRMVHVSSVDIFLKNIKGSKSYIVKGSGHLPMLEKPKETADVYLNFLKGISN